MLMLAYILRHGLNMHLVAGIDEALFNDLVQLANEHIFMWFLEVGLLDIITDQIILLPLLISFMTLLLEWTDNALQNVHPLLDIVHY